MVANKVWHLTVNRCPLTLILAPPNQRGYCFRCKKKTTIKVISERPLNPFCADRHFCHSCSLANIEELEQSDYEIENKSQIFKEIRETLNNQPVKEELLECYE